MASAPSSSNPSRNGTPSSDRTENAAKDNAADKSKKPIRVEEDVMQLARLGQIGAIRKLFDSGKFDATHQDEQGITPLHWAAIKDHYPLCHFLIESGAPMNVKGGDVAATPVLWAARSCNYYVVDLLLQHGADPLKTDEQGFNLLQNATMEGNVFQLVLLLHHDIPIDTPDSQGHTSLMWAAYKGHPSCVEVLLQWGASVSAKDDAGFTALHWALVKGSFACIQKLVEYGSDRYAQTNDGKTTSTCAKEMNTVPQWHLALADCGFNVNGSPKHFPLSSIISDRALFVSRFFFIWPFVILFCAFYILSSLSVFFGVPLALVVFFLMQTGPQRLLEWAPSNKRHLHHTVRESLD